MPKWARVPRDFCSQIMNEFWTPAANRGQGWKAVVNRDRSGVTVGSLGDIRLRCFVMWRPRCSNQRATRSGWQRSIHPEVMRLSNRRAIQILQQFELEISDKDQHNIILQWMKHISARTPESSYCRSFYGDPVLYFVQIVQGGDILIPKRLIG
jgi:hypothetical protein